MVEDAQTLLSIIVALRSIDPDSINTWPTGELADRRAAEKLLWRIKNKVKELHRIVQNKIIRMEMT